jgi:hypothetical protein
MVATWQDLAPDVVGTVLARVPVLRLAQMAHFGREFDAAYRQRHHANLTAAAGVEQSLDVLRTDSAIMLRAVDQITSLPLWGRHIEAMSQRKTSLGLEPPWSGTANRHISITPQSSFPSNSRRMSSHLACKLRNTETMEWFSVLTEVRYAVVGEKGRRPWDPSPALSCKELLFKCDLALFQDPNLAMCLLLCTAMAPPLREFMAEVSQGWPSGEGQGGEVGPEEGVRFVLPAPIPLPSQAERARIFDAVTSIVVLLGARPSQVRLAFDQVRCSSASVQKWRRLPCAINLTK